MAKIALSAEFPGFCCKFRPLENIFRTLENGHSIRHQSIPPLSAGRFLGGRKKARKIKIFLSTETPEFWEKKGKLYKEEIHVRRKSKECNKKTRQGRDGIRNRNRSTVASDARCLHEGRRCLRFLVFEPQTDHAESCEIMADHARSCP